MAVTQTITLGLTQGGLGAASAVNLSVDASIVIDDATLSGTNVEYSVAFAVARLKSLFITCDKDITIKTNNSTTPGNTITLTAGRVLLWYDGSGITNPLTVDVTKLYITQASGTAARLQLIAGIDPTP